jgi:hypothetical protein
MMFMNKCKVVFLLSLAVLVGSLHASARPDINATQRKDAGNKGQLKTTASCRQAENAVDLDINNVRARLMTGGDMWWDIGLATARYEVPKGSGKHSLFAGSVWIGGFDPQKQLKVAAQTYRQSGNDYWPGPLDATANVSSATCAEWDRFWKVSLEDINAFRQLQDKAIAVGDTRFEAIVQWPAKGNTKAEGRTGSNLNLEGADREYAPFEDVDGDGKYDATQGDYPKIDGDQYIWWVFNDKGNVKGQTGTEGIGIEVQASAFAYTAQNALNDATFYNYRLINRGNLTLDSTYIATWTDADLGFYRDDYIGCDTTRGLGILYNGASRDGQGEVNSYGTNIPMVGIDFFKGPKKTYDSAGVQVTKTLSMEAFTYYNNDFSVIGNPNNGIQIYNYMTGSILNGQRFSYDFKGANVPSRGYGEGPTTRFVFSGDPGVKTEWSECTCNNPVGDRRFVHSSGPFKLDPGVVNDITIGAVWVSDVGGCPNTSFKKIRAADDLAQALFNNNFERIEGPEAPDLVKRELDRKLVFYLNNPEESSNYLEGFGTILSEDKFRVSALSSKTVRSNDSLYKFEGYRVFQLKDKDVAIQDIFTAAGEVNTDLAIEVFQSDVKNGVSRIINYNRATDISDSTYIPVVRVTGKDSGIRHSFEVTIDQFATGPDKRLVNYRNYYFVALAYAYNEFARFDPKRADETQDIVYLGSEKGAGGKAIQVIEAMPNPANGDFGTTLNTDFGSGVIIKRLEGVGNGGVALQMSDESEAEAIANGQSVFPTYKAGAGPVDVKVIDPVKIRPANYELSIYGPNQNDPAAGLNGTATMWKLHISKSDGDVDIYSERFIDTYNEQILADYGLSIGVQQQLRPGVDQANGNGYITSEITFADPGKPWLIGTQDGEARTFNNWIRAGNVSTDTFKACNFNDRVGLGYDTVLQVYETMLSNNSANRGTWAPYALGAENNNRDESYCAYAVTKTTTAVGLYSLPSVDVVITSDKSKWTRCVVLEMQEVPALAEGGAAKFELRKHKGWNMEVDANGRPIYSDAPEDMGMSWFPGYAINQETGERLNIVFGEDSWLKNYNGNDMLWNPSTESIYFDATGQASKVFGGKHYVYVVNTKYDRGESFRRTIDPSNTLITINRAFRDIAWVGNPLLRDGFQYKSFNEGFIPTDVRIKFRVTRPYANYPTPATAENGNNGGNPRYQFSTYDLAPTPIVNNGKIDKQALLDRMHVVPNPYYAYAGYEANRLDTRVRIVNLPQRATISIYALDGTLIRRVEKDDPNTSYADWDLKNMRGLPIASGMYLVHINARGIGETVVKWFGAMRPVDITTY